MNIYIEQVFPAKDSISQTLIQLGFTLLDEDCDANEIEIYLGSQVFERFEASQLVNLKLIQLASAGYDRFDVALAAKLNILLANARDVYSIPIAEFVLARLLEVNKQLDEIQADQRSQIWNKRNRLVEFSQQKALVLGTGSIGYEIAKRLKAFDVTVDGVNSNGRSIPGFDHCLSLGQLASYVGEYDYLINALPLNDATHHCLNEEIFNLTKEDAVLVNIGRGPTIDEVALVKALDTHFRAVILDVFEVEPLPENHPLWTHPKSYVSSHTSFGSNLYLSRLETIAVQNVQAIQNQQPILNQI